MSEPDYDRNHLACPKCKSTDIDFKGLRNDTGTKPGSGAPEPDNDVVAGTYLWICTQCNHEFEVTIDS